MDNSSQTESSHCKSSSRDQEHPSSCGRSGSWLHRTGWRQLCAKQSCIRRLFQSLRTTGRFPHASCYNLLAKPNGRSISSDPARLFRPGNRQKWLATAQNIWKISDSIWIPDLLKNSFPSEWIDCATMSVREPLAYAKIATRTDIIPPFYITEDYVKARDENGQPLRIEVILGRWVAMT